MTEHLPKLTNYHVFSVAVTQFCMIFGTHKFNQILSIFIFTLYPEKLHPFNLWKIFAVRNFKLKSNYFNTHFTL